jgi:hypothetical protein
MNEDKKMTVKRVEEIVETLKKQVVGLYAIGYYNGDEWEDFHQNTVGFATIRSEAKLLVNGIMKRSPASFLKGWHELPSGTSLAFTDTGESYSIWLVTEENFEAEVLVREPSQV